MRWFYRLLVPDFAVEAIGSTRMERPVLVYFDEVAPFGEADAETVLRTVLNRREAR